MASSSTFPSFMKGDDRNGTSSERPIRFVYFDKDGNFKMNPDAIDVLQRIQEPVAVVSVCGPCRQGKSFILNQLLGKSPGFQIASTHRPCTEGLWMWSTPLKRIAPDGTEYNLLLFDSGGINAYDQTGVHSSQIISLAVLLSSLFIYNQVGVIDEAALHRLFLVTEMYKHIRGRASEGNDLISEFGHFTPEFIWLLRDFYLDLVEDNTRITPHDYLDLALRPMVGGGKDIATKNQICESIRAVFPKRECFTLVRPLNNETNLQHLDQISCDKFRQEFQSGLDAFSKFVCERTRPKQVGGTAVTGPFLAAMAGSFLDVLNNGKVPALSSSLQVCTKDTFIEANLQCSDVIKSMEKKLQEACLVADARIESVAMVLERLVSEYEASVHCPTKWQKLSSFLQKSLQGPILLHAKKLIDEILLEKSSLMLKCCSSEDKNELLHKQLEASDKLKVEYQKRYDDAIKDFKKISDQYKSRMVDLEQKCSLLEERCSSSLEMLDSAKQESLQWERKYEEILTEKGRAGNEQVNTKTAVLKSGVCEEAKVTTAEQSQLDLEEAKEWKGKYDTIVNEFKASMEKVAEQAKHREEALTAKFTDSLLEKDKEIKEMATKLDESESKVATLTSDLKAAKTKMENYDSESSVLKLQIKELAEKYELGKASSQSMETEAQMLIEERQLKQKYLSALKRRFEEAFKVSVEESKINEIIETAKSEALVAENGNCHSQHLTTDSLAQTINALSDIAILEREKKDVDGKEVILMEEITSLEAMVRDREQEMELLIKKCEQCGSSIQIHDGSLESKYAAHLEANRMGESPFSQPGPMQENLNLLEQELALDSDSNESALCPSLKSYSGKKHSRLEVPEMSFCSFEVETSQEMVREMKKAKSTLALEKCTTREVDSIFKADEEAYEDGEAASADYTKLTVVKLRQELHEHGFGSELKKLKHPKKKDILTLYRTLVLKK